MRITAPVLKNENGNVIFIVILLLAVVTVIGLSSVDNSTLELQTSANDQNYRISFYLADSGVDASANLIERTIADDRYGASGDQTWKSKFVPESDNPQNFWNELLAMNRSSTDGQRMTFQLDGYPVENLVDFDGDRPERAPGSEYTYFFYFDINSESTGPQNAHGNIQAMHRSSQTINEGS